MEAQDRQAFKEELIRDLRVEVLALSLGEDLLIDEEEAARLLKISQSKLRKMRAAGEIRCGFIGDKPRYSLGQIRRYMRECFTRR